MPDVSPSLQTHRFLQTAEMVKPSTPSPSHESSSTAGSDEGTEYYPHLGESRSGARAMGKRDLGSALILGKGTERVSWAFLSDPHCFCILGIPGLQKQALG